MLVGVGCRQLPITIILYFSHMVVSEVQLRDKNNDVMFRTESFTVTQDPDIETSKVSMSP